MALNPPRKAEDAEQFNFSDCPCTPPWASGWTVRPKKDGDRKSAVAVVSLASPPPEGARMLLQKLKLQVSAHCRGGMIRYVSGVPSRLYWIGSR